MLHKKCLSSQRSECKFTYSDILITCDFHHNGGTAYYPCMEGKMCVLHYRYLPPNGARNCAPDTHYINSKGISLTKIYQ